MSFAIIHGDALTMLRAMPDESVNCCVTSPPYWGLRDYGCLDQIGIEKTPAEFVARLLEVFSEVRRVLRADGTLWLNLGDSYATGAGKVGDCPGGGEQGDRWKGKNDSKGRGTSARCDGRGGHVYYGPSTQPNRLPLPGLKPKDLIGIPWRVAFALQADGWWLRSDIIWHKPNPMPESVTDRPTKAHEYLFLLAKSERYFYDADAIRESSQSAGRPLHFSTVQADAIGRKPTGNQLAENYGKPRGEYRNKRSVWTLATLPTPEAHFATYPIELPELCIRAGCPEGGTVLDPFAGAGTTGLACLKNGRRFVGIELNAEYIKIAEGRAQKYYPLLMETSA